MDSNRRAAKSGVFYALASMLNAGIIFLTTPYFTRVMSQQAFGDYNNFISWNSILSVLSLNLGATLISARRDFEKEMKSYVASITVFNFVIVGCLAFLSFVFRKWCGRVFNLDFEWILVMFVYIAFYQVFSIYQANERFHFRYKKSVMLSIVCALLGGGVPIVLMKIMSNQFAARTIGYVMPSVFVGLIGLFFILKDSSTIHVSYWKYALPICLPFIPHLLSLTVLNSLDKTMITKMIGSEKTAIYSVAYTCGSLISLFVGILNNAFAPWVAEKVNQDETEEIKKVSKYYIYIFQIVLFGVLLISPEIVYVIGGEQYAEAAKIVPAISIGCSLQLIYTMYVNIEQLYKKTVGMAVISMIAAGTNALLNFILIPSYGYHISAYTTLSGYLILALGHIFILRINKFEIYNDKLSVGVIILSIIEVPLFVLLYSNGLIRVFALAVYVLLLVILLIKIRKSIFAFLCSFWRRDS